MFAPDGVRNDLSFLSDMNEDRLRKAPNIALVGSTSLLGKELRQMLEDGGFPMGRLILMETEEYAGLLQEFAGEIQITQVISPASFGDIDIAFFTCSPEIMQAYVASGANFPDLTIDLTQDGRQGSIYLQGISDPRSLKASGYYVNPHPAAIVIARLLSTLQVKFLIQSAVVTILEPASERGSGGVDELQEQTVNLLNFQGIANKVFAGQLAFNILQDRQAAAATESRVLTQLRAILGETFPMPLINAVQAPVFYSHAFSIFVQLPGAPPLEEIVGQLGMSGGSFTFDDPSPVGVVGTDTIHVGRIGHSPDATWYSFWLAADNLRIAASNAIQTAENIMLASALER
jgi:aspartate-semialdehyde dehydrogenase